MTTDNQALLSAIRQIVSESVSEAIVPLTGRIDVLTERVDALTERVDALTERSQRMEAEQRDQRTLLNAMSTQASSQSLHIMRIDSLIETIDMRTNQMTSDLSDVSDRLRQVEDRVRDGFKVSSRISRSHSAIFAPCALLRIARIKRSRRCMTSEPASSSASLPWKAGRHNY
jgi:prefoldin subunit 5